MFYRLGQAFSRPFAAYAYPLKKRLGFVPARVPFEEVIEQDVTVTDSTLIETIHNEVITSSVSVTQIIDLSSLATVTHTVRINESYFLIHNDVNVLFDYIGVSDFISDTLTLSDQVTIDQEVLGYIEHRINRLIQRLIPSSNFASDITLVLSSLLESQSIFDPQHDTLRTLKDYDEGSTLFVKSEFLPSLYIGRPTTPRPIVSGIPIIFGWQTVLHTPLGYLVLPTPEFDDIQSNNDSIDIKRTMAKTYKTYVKRSRTQILNYTWLLNYEKAAEFKAWIKVNLSERVTIVNWKGEIWEGHIINSDFTFTAEDAYKGKGRQLTSATLDFEGIKILG